VRRRCAERSLFAALQVTRCDADPEEIQARRRCQGCFAAKHR
jgi:hypothetical protein